MYRTLIGIFAVFFLSACPTGTTDETDVNTADAGSSPCEQSEEVCGVASNSPNYTCEDGETVAGPGPCERNEAGECAWAFVRCPEDE